MKQCYIFAGAPASEDEYAFLRTLDFTGAYVLCADAGLLHALRLGVHPDVVMGDFDNYRGDIPEGIEVLRAAAEKDDTDTMLAVKYAISHGYGRITILCALGGRFDHSYANIQALAYILESGNTGEILSAHDSLRLLRDGTLMLPPTEGYVSVFAYTPVCSGVTLGGFKYPLHNATLQNSFPLGVSNQLLHAENGGSITVGTGTLLIILSKETNHS